MITGLPPYSGELPIEYSLRCVCARRYLVFTSMGAIISDSRARAKERAAQMKALFIDARLIPFMNCECGQALDFMPDDSVIVN